MPIAPFVPAFRPDRRTALLAGACSTAALALPAGARSSRPAGPPPAVVAPLAPLAPLALEVPGAERPVRLESLTVATEVAGGIAETRVEMVFVNPNDRVLEGRLAFPLGPNQSVTGFALDVEGRLRDAVPVPKARAEQVFEDVSRQRVDPGLLQQVAGNRHELRLYPLPARGTRTVALTLTEPATGRLAIPLGYADAVARLAVSVRYPGAVDRPEIEADAGLGLAFVADRAGGWTARGTAADAALPRVPLVVRGPVARGAETTTEARGDAAWFSASVPIGDGNGRTRARPLPRLLQIVWDRSASMATRDRGREFALLDAGFRQAGTVDVTLVRVADAVQPAERHAVRGGDWSSLRRSLEAAVHDGASRLGAVVHDGVSTEALWFTDGLSSWGAPWRPSFPVPVRAVVATVAADRPLLARLAESSGGRLVDLVATTDAEARHAFLGGGAEVTSVEATGAREVLLASRHPVDGRIALAGVFDGDARTATLVLRVRRADGGTAAIPVAVDRARHAGRLAAAAWARLALAAAAGPAPDDRARRAAIGQRFAIPSEETSLLVLERASDYARHAIPVPAGEPALLAEVQAIVARAESGVAAGRAARIERVARRHAERIAWWSRDFRKDPAAGDVDALATAGPAGRSRELARAAPPPAPAPAPTLPASPGSPTQATQATRSAPAADTLALATRSDDRASARLALAGRRPAGGAAEPEERGAQAATIALRPAPDPAWLRRLESAPPAERIAIYGALRAENARSVGFFLEAADWFLARGDRASRAIGLTALSNLAELDVPSRQLLRLLAYRLGQAGEHGLAVEVFERVRTLAPHEPQSHRDLGLALAARDAPGDRQRALEALHAVAVGTWDGRFADVEVIALVELNALVARSAREGAALDLSAVDPRLVRNLPLDLRVVLAWDADDTDVDLHVVDPDGDTVFYGRPLSRQGGAITRDATGGYGPEEFALRVAKPGRYRVEAHFYGHRQQVLAGSTGLMLRLSTGWGTAGQQDRQTTRRIASRGGQQVVVGEIEVGGGRR